MPDDFGKKVERFGQDIWRKTQGAFGVLSKNTEIAAKSRELRTVYTEIGRQYCSKHAAEAGNEFPELCAQALQMAQEIATLETEVLAQKGCRKCASCGESVAITAAFCPSCGAAQPKEEPPVEEASFDAEDGWVCPGCGAKADDDDAFCSVCGAKRP